MGKASAQHHAKDQTSPRPWSHGTLYWNELMTRDVERAKKFYADTLGWTFAPMPMPDGGTYWLANSGSQMAGGMFELKCPEFDGVPESWMSYLTVDDVDNASARRSRPAPSL
jgi:predicted enzyme related to lactoylglutathione lyase